MVFIERGTAIYAYAETAQQRRARLFSPSNAVKDPGIDLKRNRSTAITGKSSTPEELKQDYNVIDWAKLRAASKPKVYSTQILPAGRPSLLEIKRSVSEFYVIPMSQIDSADRRQEVAKARHMAVWLARSQTKRPWGEIARVILRDHTTLINSFKRIDKLVREGDPVTHQEIRGIWAGINAYRAIMGSISAEPQPYLALELEDQACLSRPEICFLAEAGATRMASAKAQGVLDFTWSAIPRDFVGPARPAAAGYRQHTESLTGLSSDGANCG